MRIYFLVGVILLFSSMDAFSQQAQPLRYKDFVFSAATVKKNISYKKDIPPGIKEKYYLLDVYEPDADTAAKRPLIIWMHGGGFKYGKKTSGGIPLWGNTFAKRGYVCASINYRLSKKKPLRNFADLADGCYDAIEDLQQAVTFFKNNQAQYRIDTNRIILAGNSAGAMIALQAVYANFAELGKMAHRADSATAFTNYNPMGIAAVINYWGALFDINWLKNEHVPIVSAHGSKDKVVNYNHKNGPMYGSFSIHQQADSLHIPNRLKTYNGFGHELQRHFNPFWAFHKTKLRWLEAGQFAADFLYKELFQ